MANNTKALAVLVACLGLAWLVSTYTRPLNDVYPFTCVIRDSHGTTIRLYVIDEAVWQNLLAMKQQGLHKWVGGRLLRDSQSELGFRFDSENVVVADFTAEGLQTWLLDISNHLEYWLSIGFAYVWAEVAD